MFFIKFSDCQLDLKDIYLTEMFRKSNLLQNACD